MEKRELTISGKREIVNPSKKVIIVPRKKIAEFQAIAKREYEYPPMCCSKKKEKIDKVRAMRVKQLIKNFING